MEMQNPTLPPAANATGIPAAGENININKPNDGESDGDAECRLCYNSPTSSSNHPSTPMNTIHSGYNSTPSNANTKYRSINQPLPPALLQHLSHSLRRFPNLP